MEINYDNIGWKDIGIQRFVLWESTLNLILEGGINYPVDLIKTRMQVDVVSLSFGQYHSLLHAVQSIHRTEGFFGFWKGFSTTLLGNIPSSTLYYVSYEFVKDKLGDFLIGHEQILAGCSGFVAEFIAGIVWVPLDVVAQRLQIQGPRSRYYKGVLNCFARIYREERLQGFYRGYMASMLAYGPGSAIAWMLFERLKQVAFSYNPHHNPHVFSNSSLVIYFAAGLIVGVVAMFVCPPADVIKTRLQTDFFVQAMATTKTPVLSSINDLPKLRTMNNIHNMNNNHVIHYKYSSMLTTFSSLVREESYRALFKGLLPRLLFYSPLTGFSFAIYEYSKYLSL